jgi:predicted aspartyl protease
MTSRWIATAFVSLALLVPIAARADDACHLYRVTSLDMTIDSAGGANIPVSIAGHTVNLLVDTGGVYSMLTEATVASLGLKEEPVSGGFMLFGGVKLDHMVTAQDFQIGRLKADDTQLLVMPTGRVPASVGGTLAPDFMSRYDVDFDFANLKFSFFSKDHCPGKVVYWTDADQYSIVDFRVDRFGHISFSVNLDGEDVRVEMDTGSSRSIMPSEMAEGIFHVDPDASGTKDSDDTKMDAHKNPFKTLTFGGVAVTNPNFALIPEDNSKVRKIILGMNILRRLHIYIAYDEHKLYVSAASATRVPRGEGAAH